MKKEFSDVQSLGEWLVIATQGLVPAAQDRIKLEIEAHYADIVGARSRDGMTDGDAKASALLELGDPSHAAREFRKKHLTEDEKKYLENWVTSSRGSLGFDWVFLCILFVNVAFQTWMLFYSRLTFSISEWIGLGWTACCLIGYALISDRLRNLFRGAFPSREFIRRFLKLQSGKWIFAGSVLMTSPMVSGHFVMMTLMNLLLLTLNVGIWLSQRRYLCQKLNKFGAPESFDFVGK